MLTILELVLKGGFRTSEFWVTVAGLLVTASAPLVQGWVTSLHAQQTQSSGVTALGLGIAAAILSGTYTIARTLTKGKVANAAAVIESAPAPDAVVSNPPATAEVIRTASGNVMTPASGSASLEEAHRSAIVAATSALEVARAALEKASNLPRPASFGTAESAPPAPVPPTSAATAPVSSSSSSSGVSPGAP